MHSESVSRPSLALPVRRTRDVVGRGVLDRKGERVGSVRDLLLDGTGAVTYFEVDLGVFRKQVIIPASFIDWGERTIAVRRLSSEEIGRLPAYDTERPITEAVLEELEYAYPAYYASEESLVELPEDRRVVPLREAKDFKLGRGGPDIRNWNVFGADSERVGRVSDLLVDPTVMKVAFVEVDLSDDLFRLRDDRHVCVPIEHVDLRERGRDVWVRGLAAYEVARLPAYTGGVMSPVVLHRVAQAFGDGDGAGPMSATAQAPPIELVPGNLDTTARDEQVTDSGRAGEHRRDRHPAPEGDASGRDRRE